MKNLESLNWKAVEKEYLEKTKWFINDLSKGDTKVLYFYGTGYYDLVATERDGVRNTMPLQVLKELLWLDNSANIYDIMGIFERNFRSIPMEEYDAENNLGRIEEKTKKFWQLYEVVKALKAGKELVLESTENQYGENIITDRILYVGGLFVREWLNCHSSEQYGMGICGCINHQAVKTEIITPEEVLGCIREYLFSKHNEKQRDIKMLEKIKKNLNTQGWCDVQTEGSGICNITTENGKFIFAGEGANWDSVEYITLEELFESEGYDFLEIF